MTKIKCKSQIEANFFSGKTNLQISEIYMSSKFWSFYKVLFERQSILIKTAGC